MLSEILSRFWWMTLLRGTLWILFGLLAFFQPALSLATLILLFGAMAFADGIGNVVTAIGGRHHNDHWVVLLLAGLAGIGAGVLTFLYPGATALVLLFWIAGWAMVTGGMAIVAAIRLRKEIEGEFWLILAGGLSVAFGAFLIVQPGTGALSVLWLIASYAVVFGVTLIALALRARSFLKQRIAVRH